MAELIERGRVIEILKDLSNDIEDIPCDAFGNCAKNYIEGWRDGLSTAIDEIEVLPCKKGVNKIER